VKKTDRFKFNIEFVCQDGYSVDKERKEFFLYIYRAQFNQKEAHDDSLKKK
jgi:hypothetical protein